MQHVQVAIHVSPGKSQLRTLIKRPRARGRERAKHMLDVRGFMAQPLLLCPTVCKTGHET